MFIAGIAVAKRVQSTCFLHIVCPACPINLPSFQLLSQPPRLRNTDPSIKQYDLLCITLQSQSYLAFLTQRWSLGYR
jgi:hypothetical protein